MGNQIKKGALLSYISVLLNMIISFLYTPWIIKTIGQSDYGLYTLATSIISIFLLDFGISGSISRFISLYRARGEEEKINDFLSITAKLYLFITMIIAIVVIFFFFYIEVIYYKLTPVELEKFKIVYLIVGVISIFSFPFMPLNGILSSYERFVALKTFDMMQKLFTVFAVIISLVNGKGLYTLVFLNALSQLIFIVFKLIYIQRNFPMHLNLKYQNQILLKQLLSFSSWVFLIAILQRLIINISPSIIAATYGSLGVSIFSIGQTFDSYLYTIGNALNGLFLPTVTKISIEKDNLESITKLSIKIGRFQIMIVCLLILGIVFFGKEFIMLWVGKEFIPSYYVAIFLIIPNLIPMTQEIPYNYLIAKNEIRYRVFGYAITCIVSLSFSFVLTPKLGAVGAAFAAGTGILCGHVLFMNYVYQRKIGINIKLFLQKCYVPFIKIIIICVLLGFILNVIFLNYNWVTLFIKILIFTSLYIISLYCFYMNKLEKNQIKSFIKGRIKNG